MIAYTNLKLSIDSSTIQDMALGINVKDNALLVARQSSFINNASGSIHFIRMNANPYLGSITKNTFKSNAAFVPINGLAKPQYGIRIVNSTGIQLGDSSNTNLGNHFEKLYTGVYIHATSSIATTLPSNSNHIGLYNNTFKEIAQLYAQANYSQALQDVYQSPKGSGVFIDYSNVPAFNAKTTVSYTGANTASLALFEQCTKAIVSKNNNLIAEKLNIAQCDFGIMNYNLINKDVVLAKNTITQAHIGTQLAGNYNNYNINQNTISISQGVEISNAGFGAQAMMYPAIGIDLKQLNTPYNPLQTHYVQNNTISIPYYAGKGIANFGTNASLLIKDNTINFTVVNNTPLANVPYIDASLYGIYNSNSKDFKLDNNLVDGQYAQALYNSTYSKAYYFETCKEMIISCNKGRATKQGLYAWGDNTTQKNFIRSNKFKYNLNPLYTLDNGAAQPGSFGDIGDGNADNNNFWLYNMPNGTGWLQSNLYKIWRNSNVQSPYKIFTSTNLLLQIESGSTNNNFFAYLVQNPNGMTSSNAECPALDFGNSAAPPNIITVSQGDDNATTIASQSEMYINYAEVGAWMNHQWLYEQLSQDETLRNSSPILASFYTNYQNGTIGAIFNVELALATLFNFEGNEQDFIAQYNNAINANNNMVLNEDYETNIQTINEIALNIIYSGIDSLSFTQKLELEILANTCPYVGGSAVYTARTLYALINPQAQYNDRFLCIQGQNKNGDNKYINIDSLYEAETNIEANKLAQQHNVNTLSKTLASTTIKTNEFEDILLYPNPANDYLTISNYNDDGEFILYNSIGAILLKEKLYKQVEAKKIKLPNLSKGIYHYKIVLSKNNYTGKLNIIQHE